MDYLSTSATFPPLTPDRLNTMSSSPARHVHQHHSSTSTSSPVNSQSPGVKYTIPKSPQLTRPQLRRPSASAPGLSTQPDQSAPFLGTVSPPLSPRPEYTGVHHVLETHHIQRHHNHQTGNPTINNYEILGDIGAGVHGRVKKAMDSETGVIVAIKIINRVTKKRLGNFDPNEQENKIKREIAIMKKCHHPNIVNLIEVIDNPNSQKVYLVLEYMERGEIKWRDRNHRPILSVDEIRPMIRDVVLGLEYLHFQGIIHRDIKPGNLLISNSGTVKISDFGVSHLAKVDEAGQSMPENDLDLAKTAGSPAFFAPEICRVDAETGRPNITKAIDVWALGVTFYCLLFGREPFPDVQGEMELYDKICNAPIEIPADHESRVDKDTKDLLFRLLEKKAADRITLYQVRRHPFITKDIPDPKKWAEETDLFQTSQPLEVTHEEVESAITRISNIVRRTLAQVKMTAKRSMSYLRPRQPSSGRIVSGVSSPTLSIATSTVSSTPSNAGVKDLFATSPKSDVMENRPQFSPSYFNSSGVRAVDESPPTPPDSGKVDSVLPVQNGATANGHNHTECNSKPSELTPPTDYTKPMEHHLNDDYSNLYYSDESEDLSDEDDRLEMNFGRKKSLA